MSSSAPKCPGRYSLHWHHCLGYLACHTGILPLQVDLEDGLTEPQINTCHAKAQGMRESIRSLPGWRPEIHHMVMRQELAFKREQRSSGWALAAIRQPARSNLPAITNLEKVLAKKN